jgi:membrane-bound metal-dependent hydrolase YbcI (DUF457 family)
MPTPVGHSLAGIAVALAGECGRLPRDLRRFLARPMTLVCVALATLPDADLLFPGFHRTATHSVTATIVVSIVAAAVTARATTRRSATGGALGRIAWSAVVMCAAAHGSHILLDWLGRDPSKMPGIQALWPLSDRWFISGWDIFPGEERRHLFSVPAMVRNLSVLAWELGILGPVVIALWWLRQRPRSTTEVAALTE